MSLVVFDGVTLALGDRTILSRVDLKIEAGEFIGLLGPNGAGKTTLMRSILGLVAPSAGSVSMDGRPVARGDRSIGYMPQSRGSTDLRATGWDLVAGAVGGHRWGLPRLDRAGRDEVAWALDTVGATALADRPIGELSGGERQRLLLSQALIGRPKLLLLDEPLINLDPTHQRGVVELVSRLQKELGIAVLFSAHELNPLLNAIDRVLYVGNCRAVLGTVDEVITGPVLSRLYGSQIEVLHIGRRIFVMAGDVEVESEAHRHDHDHGHGDGRGPGHNGEHGGHAHARL